VSFLCIDIGTSNCRAALVSAAGRVEALDREPTGLGRQALPFSEADCDRIWTVAVKAAGRLMAANPKVDVDAVGVSSMLGYVLLDAQNHPLGPAVLYADNRAVEQAEAILRRVPDKEIHRITGRRASPELLAPKLLWMAAHEPELAARTRTVIGLKDDMVRRLTDVVSTDLAHANYSMIYDVAQGAYDRGLIRALGLEADRLLPEPVRPDRIVGGLSGHAASAIGLRQGTPVVSGSSDGTTAMYGGGLHDRSQAVLVSGSTDVLMMPAHGYPESASMALTINSGLESSSFLAGGATGYSGAALERFEVLFNRSFGSVEAAVSRVPPGARGLFVFPGLSGERAPYWRSGATGALRGLTMMHEPEHVFRALAEAISYRVRRLVKGLQQAGLDPEAIKVVGGLGGNDTINQIRADVAGVPMVRLEQLESTCLGTAMFCMSGLEGGGKVLDISRAWVKRRKFFEPDIKNTKTYDRLARTFEEALILYI
jgi:xylulokinase